MSRIDVPKACIAYTSKQNICMTELARIPKQDIAVPCGCHRQGRAETPGDAEDMCTRTNQGVVAVHFAKYLSLLSYEIEDIFFVPYELIAGVVVLL
jgi:hypothetical protein